jgi:4-hydroxybenzoate polyprenyltransferase
MASNSATDQSASVTEMAVGLLKTLRPHQWVKNLFVLAPLFFSQQFYDTDRLIQGITAALLFCLGSGTVYIVNDIFDVEEDRNHPVKQYRPIPSGQLPISAAKLAAWVLGVGVVGAAWFIHPWLAGAIGGYMVMNLAYSVLLKEIAFLDVTIIATGFVLRILAGKFATDVYLSEWLITCTFLVALYLGLGKRSHELHLYRTTDNDKTRKVLEQYSPDWLDFGLLYVAGLTIAAYTIYSLTAALPELTKALTTQPLRKRPTPFAHPLLPVTVLFVVFGIVRFYQLVQSDKPSSPTDLLLEDWPFVLNVVLWGGVMLVFAFV